MGLSYKQIIFIGTVIVLIGDIIATYIAEMELRNVTDDVDAQLKLLDETSSKLAFVGDALIAIGTQLDTLYGSEDDTENDDPQDNKNNSRETNNKNRGKGSGENSGNLNTYGQNELKDSDRLEFIGNWLTVIADFILLEAGRLEKYEEASAKEKA